MQIVITPAPRGEYTIKYGYTCTDVDKYPRGMEFYFTDENGYKTNRTTQTLREKGMINRTLVARNDNRSLVLNLGKYTSLDKGTTKQKGKKKKRTLPPKLQDFKVENLVVTHKLKEEEAIDSLFNRYVDVKIFADGFLIQKDSLALSPDSTRVSTEASIDD